MTGPAPRSLGTVLAKRRGVGPGFDLLRVVLALGVVAWHTFTATGRVDIEPLRFVWFPGYGILVMFFALSGFLITASALRLRLTDFLVNRSLRIVPALFVEVALSAFILGALFTTLPLGRYFADPGLWRYFTNVVGLVNYRLPGVFEQNPDPAVNNSLWTIPFEIGCYAIISAFVLIGALKRPALILLAFAAFAALSFAVAALGDALPGTAGALARAVFLGRGSRLFAAFLLGIAAYLHRDRIPYSPALAAFCLAACVVTAAVGPASWLTLPWLNLLIAPALVYLTVFVGVSDVPPLPLFARGDYSYGIYLYGFPIQQAMVAVLPAGATPLVVLVLATPLVILFAIASWHLVEKPILHLRRRFSFMAQARLEAAAPSPRPARPLPSGAAPRR